MIQMRWTTYVVSLLGVAVVMGLLALPGALREAGAQVPHTVRTRPAAPTMGEPASPRGTPSYLVEQYTDTQALEQGLNSRARQGYLVVSVQAVHTRVGNPNDQIFRVSYRNTLDIYPVWVVVYTQ